MGSLQALGGSVSHPARSLVPHAAALAVIMLVVLPMIGWHGVVSSDEGAGMAQARAISDGHSFSLPHPFPEADPTGVAFPLEQSATTEDGFAPLPKKPAYSVGLAIVDRLGGIPAMFLLSIAGTIAAAFCAALVAEQIGPHLRTLTFWLTGLASPLFTDGYLVIAHTLGAAFCGAGLLFALRALERASVVRLALTALCLVLAGCLRAEAVLFGLAMAISLGVAASRQRDMRTSLAALAALLGAVGGYLLDRTLSVTAFGTRVVGVPSMGSDAGGGGYFAGRVQGLVTTWFRSGYGAMDGPGLLIIAVAVLGLIGALQLRRRTVEQQALRMLALAVMAFSISAAWLYASGQPHLVPGILLAFPALSWGLVLLDRASLTALPARVLALTAFLFATAVLATQYAVGGAWEWGGRYFAIGLPCVTPLVAAGLKHAWMRLDRDAARLCAAGLLVPSVALSVMGALSVRHFHDGWRDFVGSVSVVAASTDPGDGGMPVVLTTERELPRAAWQEMTRSRWLLVPDEGIPAMLNRLSELHVREVVFVSKGPGRAELVQRSAYDDDQTNPVVPQDPDTWWVTTLRLR